jgi:hypothetical protein
MRHASRRLRAWLIFDVRQIMTALPKFESQDGNDWRLHEYPKVFVRERTTGPDRLKIAASKGGTDLLLQLAAVLSGPFSVLYVLHVARGGSAEGRYQSPWMERHALTALIERIADCLEQDGRHHLWLFSGSDRATLVFDHHNVIFAYGPLEDLVRLLEAAGYSEAPELNYPAPHRHQFHAAFDEDERRITALPGWERSELREGDDE